MPARPAAMPVSQVVAGFDPQRFDAYQRAAEECDRAGMSVDEPLRIALLTTLSASLRVGELVKGARGLTPEGEAQLAERIAEAISEHAKGFGRTVQQVIAVQNPALRARTVVFSVLAAVVASGAGVAGGWLARGDALLGTEVGVQAAFAAGGAAADSWLKLLSLNRGDTVMTRCLQVVVQTSGGGKVCAPELWLELPKAWR